MTSSTQLRCRAHPRSRGENSYDVGDGLLEGGSSPLTRGKLPEGADIVSMAGLIPAHAGKTWSIRCVAFCGPAHPRSRGENAGGSRNEHQQAGSSPLTRGKRRQALDYRPLCGLIPAHAGKTLAGLRCVAYFGAHPRSRGENTARQCEATRRPGSSPLTRGKPCRAGRLRSARRLIPAHAGKTQRRHPACTGHGAHPRSRGENSDWETIDGRAGGSSPLTRGKQARGCPQSGQWGLIPAHAGKTR